ncbi:histidine ammonia-lyase [candidate division KSB1 bacterium]
MVKHKAQIGTIIHISDVAHAAAGAVSVSISRQTENRVLCSNKMLHSYSKENTIYGINTGFGPMSRVHIGPKKQQELQYNLIRSHAAGQGEPISVSHVRAMMLARLHTLTLGFSGVSIGVVRTLKRFIEKDIVPVVPEHGSVGASGDLVQLAHIALALIGEGDVVSGGKKMTAKSALKKHKVSVATLTGRDGLALINGTSAMTAIAAVNIHKAKRLVHLALIAAALLLEIAEADRESIHPVVSSVRPHKGQESAARKIRNLLRGSHLVVPHKRRKSVSVPSDSDTVETSDSVQEIYSLRCVAQVIGPVLDTLSYAEQVVETEINSVTDNPIISKEHGVVHAGNFHGDYVSLEMDKLRIAITKLSILLERQLNFLCNDRINQKLPPFVNLGVVGLDLGLQGLQFVATSTVAENQTLATPISTHSITTNNDNQDVVSMGANASLLTDKVIENTYQITSILFAAILQAVDHLSQQDRMSPKTMSAYTELRRAFPRFTKDKPLSRDVERLRDRLKTLDISEY